MMVILGMIAVDCDLALDARYRCGTSGATQPSTANSHSEELRSTFIQTGVSFPDHFEPGYNSPIRPFTLRAYHPAETQLHILQREGSDSPMHVSTATSWYPLFLSRSTAYGVTSKAPTSTVQHRSMRNERGGGNLLVV